MPDDDNLLSQGTVDFRNEGRRAYQQPQAEGSHAALTAITGTWSDLERHARYVYANADEQSSEWMLAEAVLVLLNLDRATRSANSQPKEPTA